MIFKVHPLQQPICNFIESLFYYKGFQPDHSIERVVPTGHVFILFELDNIQRNTYENKTLKPNGVFQKVWVSGMHKHYLSISAHQDSEMLVFQLKAEGCLPFLHHSANVLNNKVVNAEGIFGNEILDLREQMFLEPSIAGKFKIAEDWILNRFQEKSVPSQELIGVLSELKTQPISKHNELIAAYPKTQKHLINQFKKYFGLTPKTFHRIYRFNEILQQIHQKQNISWSQISYQFGYSDQSHFIKEFKEFSGFNPQEFIIADHHLDQPNFFPIDKKT